jgi:HAD superfamily hydrolase (TIGR01493 family)
VKAYRAVLFDWMLTLADYPPPAVHIEQAALRLGRRIAPTERDAIVAKLARAASLPEVLSAARTEDCSPAEHVHATMLHYERAGIGAQLADAMYGLLGDPDFHPIYPEVRRVLHALAEMDITVVVVSDIHVDLREHARQAGLADLIDGWVLSYEHGVQKPDPSIFELALQAAGAPAQDVLMVGDRASHDGAASGLGIDTLILPARARAGTDESGRLDSVVRLVG